MKNLYEIRDDYVVIYLKGKTGIVETIIDIEDFERVNEFPNTWFARTHPKWGQTYVHGNLPRENGKQKNVILHRWLFKDGLATEQIIDHINHNTLDNRRSCNLRIVTNAQNGQNRRGANRNNRSGVRGVSWKARRNVWEASLMINGKTVYIGSFKDRADAEEAVKEYRRKAMPYSVNDLA